MCDVFEIGFLVYLWRALQRAEHPIMVAARFWSILYASRGGNIESAKVLYLNIYTRP